MTFTENPVFCLLHSRQSRKGVDKLTVGSMVLAGLLGLGAAGLEGPAVGLGATAVALLVLFPFLRAQADAGLLVSLRNGGVLDELRQTRMTSWEMVDGTTWHTMRSVLRPGLSLGVILTALAFAAAPNLYWQPVVVGAAFAWFPAAILLTWALAYFSQMLAAWTHHDRGTSTQLVGLMIVLGPLVPAIPIGLMLASNGATLAGASVLVCCCFWMASLSRLYAGIGLDSADRVHQVIEAVNRRLTVTRNQWVKAWNDNPIVIRECARDGGRTPGGLFGAVMSTYGAAVALAVVPFWTIPLFDLSLGTAGWIWMASYGVFYLIQPARAASRVSGAMVEEREKRTLESLAVTRLSTEEFVDGWAEVGWRPRLVECLAAIPAFFLMGQMAGIDPALLIPSMPLLVLNVLMGAYLGFAVGVVAPSRTEAGGDLAVLLMMGMSLAVAAGFLSMGRGPLEIFVWLYLAGGASVALARSIALKRLS